jgi:hypothetical protein
MKNTFLKKWKIVKAENGTFICDDFKTICKMRDETPHIIKAVSLVPELINQLDAFISMCSLIDARLDVEAKEKGEIYILGAIHQQLKERIELGKKLLAD